MKINKIVNRCTEGKVEIDFYVPISIIFPENDEPGNKLIYYRFINKQNSFVELTVSSSGRIMEVILLSIKDIVDQNICEMIESNCQNKLSGNPVIDFQLAENLNVITDQEEFKLYREHGKICMIKNYAQINSVLTICDHLKILIDSESSVVGFIFSGFSQIEWEKLNESINFSIISDK